MCLALLSWSCLENEISSFIIQAYGLITDQTFPTCICQRETVRPLCMTECELILQFILMCRTLSCVAFGLSRRWSVKQSQPLIPLRVLKGQRGGLGWPVSIDGYECDQRPRIQQESGSIEVSKEVSEAQDKRRKKRSWKLSWGVWGKDHKTS